MKRPRTLNARFVDTIATPGRYGDGHGGHGLSLLVKRMSTSGRWSKSWCQRIRVGGQITNIGLGAYPVVSLAMARQQALDNRRTIAEGQDPRTRRAPGVPTFETAADIVIRMHADTWKDAGKSEAQWRASLRDYAMPRIGALGVDGITTADVLAVLKPIWNTKRETARRVRQRIGAVMKWAIAEGHRSDNPAGEAIAEALPRNGHVKHHQRALPHERVPGAVACVQASRAYPSTVLAFRFLVLTAGRSGEIRGARWNEIDLDARTWTVPASRMKAKREHRVPLSSGAMAVLNAARGVSNGSELLFPGARGRELSDNTLSKQLRELGIDAVPHGFRSSFRQWAAECTNYPREVCEEALAHVNPNRFEAAYQRSDLFERRRRLMEDWARYVGDRR